MYLCVCVRAHTQLLKSSPFYLNLFCLKIFLNIFMNLVIENVQLKNGCKIDYIYTVDC